jgi:hypothetical protein
MSESRNRQPQSDRMAGKSALAETAERRKGGDATLIAAA